ncbi:MAG: hypothetical protein HY921_11125 [Elusimicrobia bacterium]|nr:hypothetical protein [Elusimicrobiota bacterium]
MSKNKPVKFNVRIDIQCGICGSLTHHAAGAFPKFCACCGAAMERFCLICHKKADMFFEEWWPEEDECLRTYSPSKRCGSCNAVLEAQGNNQFYEERGYQN